MKLVIVALVGLFTNTGTGATVNAGCGAACSPGVVAEAPWDTGAVRQAVLTCVVQKDPIVGHTLTVLRDSAKIFAFGEGDSFLGMFPTRGSGGHLVTLWATGSAYRTLVFHFEQEEVRVVLDIGSKQFPEILYEGANEDPVFLVTHYRWVVHGGGRAFIPDTAEVFRWRDGAYHSVAKFPWKDRFRAIREDQGSAGESSTDPAAGVAVGDQLGHHAGHHAP
jgi:hypothetical protein